MTGGSKGFTLVEMLVALAVGSIIVAGSYASFVLVDNQYKKIRDVADMHTSGRAIMRIIERDVRMAGFVWRDNKINKIYGDISEPLKIIDSGNKCCDEITVIYDYHNDTTNQTDRVRIRYWVEEFTGSKGTRGRLYKRRDILGRGGNILSKPIIGNKDVMADYIEDLQFGSDDHAGTAEIATLNEAALIAREILKDIYSANKDRYSRTGKYYFSDPCIRKSRRKVYSASCGNSNSRKRHNNTINTSLFDGKNECLNNYGNFFDVHIVEKKKSYSMSTSEYKRTSGTVGYESYVWFNDNLTNKLFGRCDIPRRHHGCPSRFLTSEGGEENYWATRIYRNNLPTTSECYTSNTKVNSTCGWGSAKNTLGKKSGSFAQWISDKSKFSSCGISPPSLVNIDLILRTKQQYGRNKQYKKKDYFSGNYKIDKTDGYKRDEFSTSVLVRNLAL